MSESKYFFIAFKKMFVCTFEWRRYSATITVKRIVLFLLSPSVNFAFFQMVDGTT